MNNYNLNEKRRTMEPNTKNHIDAILRNCADMTAHQAAAWAKNNIPEFEKACIYNNIKPNNFISAIRELSS